MLKRKIIIKYIYIYIYIHSSSIGEIIFCFFKTNVHKIDGINISRYVHSEEGKSQRSVTIYLVHMLCKPFSFITCKYQCGVTIYLVHKKYKMSFQLSTRKCSWRSQFNDKGLISVWERNFHFLCEF
jgi:hypothetical protein